jgi:hypothetical protein
VDQLLDLIPNGLALKGVVALFFVVIIFLLYTSLALRVKLEFYKLRKEYLNHSRGRSCILQVNALTILRDQFIS